MENYYGIEYLRKKLAQKKTRVDKRYDFYEMKNLTRDFQISTPPELYWFTSSLGWCAKAVDSLADRLHFKKFVNDNFNLGEIYQMNNPDVLFDSAITSALISSCCFVYVSPDENGFPRLQVIDGGNATGILDPITGLLKEGYAVLERDEYNAPVLEAYFIPGKTEYFYKDSKRNYSISNNVKYPLLVPIINRPDEKRQFGHSRISRACMDLQSSAIRTIKRSEIGAEFYAYPQKYITGLSEDFEIDKWKATMSSMLMFTNDDDGNHPIMGQFNAQSMTPHLEQLKMFAALFAGETGLTLDDLGFMSGNPSSSDAIKNQHENLRLAARKSQRTFGSGFLNVGIVAASLRDNFGYERSAFYETVPKWHPVFEPDSTSLAGFGDAIIKIQQAVPNYLTEEKIEELLGI